MPATYDDAQLVVQIMQWAALEKMDEAFARIHDKTFDPETATMEDAAVRKVLNYGEMVGTFVKQGVLDKGLVYDMWALDMTWKRVGPAALRHRQELGESRMYENFEALAKGAPVPAGV